MITNHTYSNLVLRPPAIAATGLSPDEPRLRALGDEMTEANGYANWASYQLYDTSGSVEDWSYWNTGGFGYTFEIGPDEFHPPFETGVVAEYLGLPPAAGAGFGGNREAYYAMAESAANPDDHATIVGSTSKNRVLTISKRFISATSPVQGPGGTVGPPRYYEDVLTSTLDPEGGTFRWSVNPSTRPLVVGRYGRDPQGPPSPPPPWRTRPASRRWETETATFDIVGPPAYDNGTATVVVGWPGANVDWDLTVYDSRGRPVSQAATLANPERAVLIDPAPGTYTVEVVNYGGGARPPTGRAASSSPRRPPAATRGSRRRGTSPARTGTAACSAPARSSSTAAGSPASATPARGSRTRRRRPRQTSGRGRVGRTARRRTGRRRVPPRRHRPPRTETRSANSSASSCGS